MRPRWTGLLAIFLVAVAGRVVVAVTVTDDYPARADHPTDALGYHILANNLAAGRGYIRPFDFRDLGHSVKTAEFPPAFPGVLAAASLVGGNSVAAHKAVTIGLGSTAAVLAALLGTAVAGRRAGYATGAIAAVHPGLLQQDSVLLAESLYSVLVAGTLVVAWPLVAQPNSRPRWALVGVLLGAAALTRGEGAVFGVAFLSALAVAARDDWRAALTGAAVASAVLVALVGSWVLRNTLVVDSTTISSNYSTLLVGANCDDAYYGRFTGTWRASCLFTPPVPPGTSEADRAERYRSIAFRYAGDNTRRLALVAGARVLRTWGWLRPGDLDDTTRSEGRDPDWDAVARVIDGMLTLLAVVALARHRAATAMILALPVVVLVATSALGYGNERFRYPVVIPLAVLATLAVVQPPRRVLAAEASDSVGACQSL